MDVLVVVVAIGSWWLIRRLLYDPLLLLLGSLNKCYAGAYSTIQIFERMKKVLTGRKEERQLQIARTTTKDTQTRTIT